MAHQPAFVIASFMFSTVFILGWIGLCAFVQLFVHPLSRSPFYLSIYLSIYRSRLIRSFVYESLKSFCTFVHRHYVIYNCNPQPHPTTLYCIIFCIRLSTLIFIICISVFASQSIFRIGYTLFFHFFTPLYVYFILVYCLIFPKIHLVCSSVCLSLPINSILFVSSLALP